MAMRVAWLVAGMSAALAACQVGPWGPLAVSDEDAWIVLEARGGAGPLRIGPRCVTLLVEEVNREITLVWRSGQTSWDPGLRQIVFDDATAGEIRLSGGQRMEVGGAGIAEPGAADQGAPQPKWLSAPDPTCPDELFAVHSVRLIGQ
jgi:hypothetical protein